MEGFQLKFIATVCRELLTGNRENIITEYQKLKTDIATGEIALSELVKQEVLKETPASYSRKLASGKGRRSAAYEVALASWQKFKAGDTVTAGQTIGTVGATALMESAIGDHVHFSVSCNGEPVNPKEFLG